MTDAEALKHARKIWRAYTNNAPEPRSFLEFAEKVADIVKEFKFHQRHKRPWLDEWAIAWRKLYDDFSRKVEMDPMLIYVPRNKASEEFHASPAFIRYFRGGNRTSKTQSGYAEDYWYATGQHPYRKVPFPSSLIVLSGLPYSEYAPKVFEKKFIEGEPDNTLSPIFPENGKWFHHYDPRKKILKIGCPDCAEVGKAKSCPHQKSTISLLSAEQGIGVLEAFSARHIHIDEHIPEKFFIASMQRLKGQRMSGMIVTGTPLHGLEAWEMRKLAHVAEGNPAENLADPENPDSPPYVSLHQVSQWDGGVATHEEIRKTIRTMDKFEISARIMGIPAPLAEHPVFDRGALEIMEKACATPTYGRLMPKESLETAATGEDITFESVTPEKITDFTGWRVWELPVKDGQYIAGVDTAAGLAGNDASCTSIIKITHIDTPHGPRLKLKLVAQFHGWLNLYHYAEEVYKGCLFYNDACCVIELTGGYGRGILARLQNEFTYWNIYRQSQLQRAESVDFNLDSRMGVDTNISTKPAMIAALQRVIIEGDIEIPCRETIGELVAYEQEKSESGKTTIYRGASGSRDDRTMSLVLASSIVMTDPEVYNPIVVTQPKVVNTHESDWGDEEWTGW